MFSSAPSLALRVTLPRCAAMRAPIAVRMPALAALHGGTSCRPLFADPSRIIARSSTPTKTGSFPSAKTLAFKAFLTRTTSPAAFMHGTGRCLLMPVCFAGPTSSRSGPCTVHRQTCFTLTHPFAGGQRSVTQVGYGPRPPDPGGSQR